ncbi:MAG: penicillin-binding protein 2 [Gammaproteobacteria bacterium]|jgi:cell division protein FtsI (penicillin-binding protein 3)|nr:penicillin-binding protein 2 [Gammaproteobacteria bacterium]
MKAGSWFFGRMQRVKAYCNFSRRGFVLFTFACTAVLLSGHAINLQLSDRDFLEDKGQERYEVKLPTDAHRGMVTDRNGEPLAISTPVNSVAVNPSELVKHRNRWNELGKILDLSPDYLDAILLPRAKRSFFYLKRHISPDVAVTLKAAGIPGVNLIDEYRRYYPSGEVTAHMLGFTNVDDRGQEGVELSFDSTLRGTKGQDLVIRDRLGRVVEHVERISDVQPGKDLALSIDRRLQYVAYRELKAAVQKHNADSGVMVVLDAETGEILAMVNAPSYNPNNRADAKREHFRNRTVTDLFEPGSTIKPFTVAAGLESGRYKPTTMIDTQGGQMRAGTVTVTDSHRAGMLSVTQVIQKSSNVGVTKIALAIEPELFWGVLNRAGFGQASGIDLPGETPGQLESYRGWGAADRVTLAFGYHTNITAVQLARAYGVFASGGLLRPVSVVKQSTVPEGTRVISEQTALAVREMMKTVIEKGGTAETAAVPGYSVAGKTGTTKRNNGTKGYEEKSYRSLFAGFLPANAPKLIGVVMIDNPRGPEYYGGLVAAPVFATVMLEATRIFNLTPDRAEDRGTVPPRFAAWTQPTNQIADQNP